MDFDPVSDLQPSEARGRLGSALGLGAAILLAAAHFAFLMKYFAPAISTPDANGYFAQARHIAVEHRTWFEVESPLQFIPTHWLSADGQRFYSKYPPGLPLIAAAVRIIAG